MKKILLLTLIAACKLPEEVKPPEFKRSDVETVASTSACAAYKWKNRQVAPKGYMKGMALVYAKSLCEESSAANQILSKPAQGSNDAFTHLGIKSVEGRASLRASYTLLIGLGMRESSGDYCEGRDYSAGSTSASTCEAGAWQTSYNARVRR